VVRVPTGALLDARWFFFLSASADDSSCAKVVGVLGTSFVLTSSPMFSTVVGMPYSFLIAVPYENASRVYFGNCALTDADG
jgi:hypothetical protein